ncbi:hypothetical protein EG328_001690 [Venturia inaequalis]|uniref:Alpha/beta-hydrolase n=1 Tax=Venturia inaequalis TaxID=5025 RepID=A0A8H3YXV0_VENIN|nr:hypothetical protein EG328_001690 [Venturia inaequalis]
MGRFISSLFFSVLFSSIAWATPIERRSISSSLLSTFNLYEQFAAAAYCPANNDSPATKLVCTSDACPLVQADNTNTIIEFQNGGATDTTGYLAIDTTKKLIVLSFRGSTSLRNYLVDVNFPLTNIDICTGCQGDSGFWGAWSDNRAQILPSVKTTVAAYPTYKVIATGHSLGGAIATFAAAELRNAGIAVDLITFGSPRALNPTGATYISAQNKGANYRLTHLNDPVPRLPPRSFGFEHVDTEYYISSAYGAVVTVADVAVCDCNDDWVALDIQAHAWYFGRISVCYDGGDTIEV